MILSDRDIRALLDSGRLVVEPLGGDTIRENGLDLRLGEEYCVLVESTMVLDTRSPGDPWERYTCSHAGSNGILIDRNERVLLHTMEYIVMPDDVAGLATLRSTWARLGLSAPPTTVDAGFEGQLTIEIVGSSFPVRLYPGERFLHLVLVKMTSPAVKPYNGEYNGQRGVRLPKIFDRIW